ncbi:hypothetical protein [Pseudomonas sp. MPB23]|jgi:hypothetical protein|uniref:hypothetical protein n=1 Tax=Pseudomonas sp. MPB23 TaxID=3388490 RepID=UPI0039853B89
MRNLHAVPLLILIAVLIPACTTQLTEAGKQIHLVTASSAQGCSVVKAFTVQGSSNGDALNLAFNKAAEVGGDSVSVIHVGEGGKMQAAALKCRR